MRRKQNVQEKIETYSISISCVTHAGKYNYTNQFTGTGNPRSTYERKQSRKQSSNQQDLLQ